MIALKKIVAFTLSAILIIGMLPAVAYATDLNNSEEKMELKFNEDGKFKILCIADPQDTDTPQKETIDTIISALDKTNPDLVIFLGDNIAGWWKGVNKEKTAKAIHQVIDPVDARGIPFAVVFGNHDHEGLIDKNNNMTEEQAKEFQLSVYQEYRTCLAIEGDELTGCGNYNLTIKDSSGNNDIFNLWLMDSNPYADEGGYGYVQPDQTEWYLNKSNELKDNNGGLPLPSILFQHIPVPEVYKLASEHSTYVKGAVKGQTKLNQKYYTANENVVQGGFKEGPCSADIAHNQFETWKQQGDIIGAFFGHDHPNDYLGKVDGITLCAVPAAGYYSYGQNHGARTIILDENDLTSFESELFNENELLNYKVKPTYKANHGYYEYKHIFLPAIKGAAIGAAALTAASIALITVIKKKKNK